MKSFPNKRQQNMTLRQYLQSNSLQKRIGLTRKSKDKNINKTLINNEFTPSLSVQKIGRQKLIDHIKLFLAENIKNEIKLAQILRMLNQLIDKYNQQLNDQHHQKGLLSTMINQHSINKSQNNIQFKQNKIKLYTQPYQPINLNDSFVSIRDINDSRKNNTQNYQNIKNTNYNNQSIPNINILLKTRRDGLHTKLKDLQTEQTLFDLQLQTDIQKNDESKISISLQQSKDHDDDIISLLSSNGSNSKNINFCDLMNKSNKKEDIHTNYSANSSRSKLSNLSYSNAMSKFQEYKRKAHK